MNCANCGLITHTVEMTETSTGIKHLLEHCPVCNRYQTRNLKNLPEIYQIYKSNNQIKNVATI